MTGTAETLPRVTWRGHEITRLVLGHNPVKGTSHVSKALSDEMREWFDPAKGNDLALLRRAEACGVNTVQFGGGAMHSLLRRHKAEGGSLGWIATFYERDRDKGGDPEAELAAILDVDPAPIGIQYFGERVDRHFIEGRMDDVHEMMKRIRGLDPIGVEGGLLVGVCTHLPQVVEEVESAGWDVDFYQTCLFTVYSHVPRVGEGRIERGEERYDDADRDRMLAAIRSASKPCIAFKVLAASRKCGSPEDVAAALRHAYDGIKETDVVAVGMWQKYGDQVGENVRLVREILSSHHG